MSDLISRQAALEMLNDNELERQTDDSFDGDLHRYKRAAQRIIAQLPPAQQWIPCSERLPKAGIRYQVTFESGEVGYADFRNKIFLLDGSVKENVWEIEEYYEEDGEVIAWMPLPEPYKAERSEE